ncbi:MAG: PhoH family protein [Patescibacteria group bacterium]|jgi:PhoH-like ATPase|nr:PhoH family protein [Patescibacteria group bacterium]
MEEKLVNLIIPDTNVLINDPYCLDKFINGGNKIVIPLIVLTELDKLKRDLRIGLDVREVIRQIEKYGFGKNELFEVEKNVDFNGLDLDKSHADYRVLATVNYVINNKKYEGYKSYKLVTNDINMRAVAYAVFKDNKKVLIEEYKQEQVEQRKSKEEIPVIKIPNFPIDIGVEYNKSVHGVLDENSGIVIKYIGKKEKEQENLFIKRGSYLQMIKNDYQLFGLKALSETERPNYGQLLAFYNLSSPDVRCIFLQGQAGTGKTLIALAAGMSQRNKYDQLIVANPMVPLSNKSNMGFLPGDVSEKLSPWLVPFEQNLKFLEKNSADQMYKSVVSGARKNSTNKLGEDNSGMTMRDKYGLTLQPLEYIRGQTIADAFIVIEEAQNLTQHEIKTIITRLGKGSKVVFCGDLSQIDIQYLTEFSSGLTYAIEKMVGLKNENKMVASIMLSTVVRSELASFASSVL